MNNQSNGFNPDLVEDIRSKIYRLESVNKLFGYQKKDRDVIKNIKKIIDETVDNIEEGMKNED